MEFTIKRAVKERAKLRLGLIGPAGSGKTYTSLLVAGALGSKILLIDTEHGSASKYADDFSFDTIQLDSFAPQTLIELIGHGEQQGYDVVIVDSLSHFWMGTGGVLEQVDQITSRSKSGNAFATGWREMSPVHNRLVDRLVGCGVHLICTLRSKTEYVVEKIDGKSVPRKVGMAPIQRDGLEYEFDVVGDLDWENNLVITKSRCKAVAKAVIPTPGTAFGAELAAWLADGVTPAPVPPAMPEQPTPAERLKDLIERHNITEQQVAKWCDHFRVASIDKLDAAQVDAICRKVESAVAQS